MEEFIVELNPEEELLRQLIEPLLDSEGFELVSLRLKIVQAKTILAVFVDTREQKNGIVLQNLEDISRLLSDVLDASFEDGSVLRGHYDLEVSSPGLDRPLSKRQHFKDALNERIKIRLKEPDEGGTRNFLGRLIEVLDDGVMFEPDNRRDEPINIKYQDLVSANIIFDFSKLDKHKKKSGRKSLDIEI